MSFLYLLHLAKLASAAAIVDTKEPVISTQAYPGSLETSPEYINPDSPKTDDPENDILYDYPESSSAIPDESTFDSQNVDPAAAEPTQTQDAQAYAQYAPPSYQPQGLREPPQAQQPYIPPGYQQQPQYEQPQYGQPRFGLPGFLRPLFEPQYGQPQYGQPQYGQPQYGQPQYGQPQYGQPQFGQPQYEQPQYGQPQPQYGQPPMEHPNGVETQPATVAGPFESGFLTTSPSTQAVATSVDEPQQTILEEPSIDAVGTNRHKKNSNELPIERSEALQNLKLDNVTQASGYLDTGSGDKLFYWFFSSRSDPAHDPVVIWLNGGPGCSSMEAILFENGPSNLDGESTLHPNQWSWNNRANVLYIDNPSGVGFSTGDKKVTDSIVAAVDFKNAITSFYDKYPFLKNNELHMSGESYAGRYIPVFAEAINKDDSCPVKVTSVIIGNGLVSPIAEYSSYGPMLCGQGGRDPVLSTQECEKIAEKEKGCLKYVEGCMNNNKFDCLMANEACSTVEGYIRRFNPYDIRDSGCAPNTNGLCYPELNNVQAYFNQDDVKSALGVPSQEQFKICNNRMNGEFYRARDPFQPTFHNITNLLESGVGVLIYNGDADIILNWLGGLQWTSGLEWSGHEGFAQAASSPTAWIPSDNKQRGQAVNYEKFTFLRVHNAGHMVPHDQPESAFYMLDAWLHGDYGFKAVNIY